MQSPGKWTERMKQLLQDLRSHEVRMDEGPPPCCLPGGVLVRGAASLISSGTERATITLGSKSLLGKLVERSDLVQQLFLQDRRHRYELRALIGAAARAGELPIPFESLGAFTLATFRIRESLRCGRALPVCPSDPA